MTCRYLFQMLYSFFSVWLLFPFFFCPQSCVVLFWSVDLENHYSPHILSFQHHNQASFFYYGKCEQPTLPEGQKLHCDHRGAKSLCVHVCLYAAMVFKLCICSLIQKQSMSYNQIRWKHDSGKLGHEYTHTHTHIKKAYFDMSELYFCLQADNDLQVKTLYLCVWTLSIPSGSRLLHQLYKCQWGRKFKKPNV